MPAILTPTYLNRPKVDYPYYDESLREPRLMVPRQKPVGPVKIDWSHPFAQGLIFYITTNNGVLMDLVSNRPLTIVGSPTGRDLGDGWRTGGAAATYAYLTVTDPRAAASDENKSFAGKIWTDDGDGDRLFSVYDGTTEKLRAAKYLSTDFMLGFGTAVAGSRTALDFVAAARTPISFIGSPLPDGSAAFASAIYQGTKYYNTDAGTNVSAVIPFDSVYFGNNPDVSTAYDSGLWYACCWYRLFSRAQHDAFLADEYQFLIPA